MAAHVFAWVIMSFLAGAAVSHFRNEIIEWANRILGYILKGINKAVEVGSDALVYLVKQGASSIVKRIVVWVKDIYSNEIRPEYKEESISLTQIPPDIKAQLAQNQELKLMQLPQGTI